MNAGSAALALTCTALASPAWATPVDGLVDVRPTDWDYQALANLIERCGGVDGLETKVGELEANQFSTTTKLRGEASFTLAGAPNFKSPQRNSDGTRPANPNKTTFNYDLRLVLDTSFTGKDLLRTRLRSGNFSRLPFRDGILILDRASGTDDSVRVDRLFYRFPAGEHVHITVGGVGFSWRQHPKPSTATFTVDASVVANNGFADASIGVLNGRSGLNALSQLGYQGANWSLALSYRYGSRNSSLRSLAAPTMGCSTNSSLAFASATTSPSPRASSTVVMWPPNHVSLLNCAAMLGARQAQPDRNLSVQH